MKITIEIQNTDKIDHHLRTLRTIADKKELNLVEQIIMNDTISIFEGIKKELFYNA
jgi:ACT domain-containing protein